jgi:hypothetical protein
MNNVFGSNGAAQCGHFGMQANVGLDAAGASLEARTSTLILTSQGASLSGARRFGGV